MVNANEMSNAEKLYNILCRKALDAVITLGLFDTDQFKDVNLFPMNHLLKWCVEVLTALEFDFFKKGDDECNCLVESVKMNFKVHYMLVLFDPMKWSSNQALE